MTLLDYFLHMEESYWSMQALLRKAICKGKWILLYGSRVIAVSDTKDEIVRFFSQFREKIDPNDQYPGAICVQVGNESKFYRIPTNEEEKSEQNPTKNSPKQIERLIFR